MKNIICFAEIRGDLFYYYQKRIDLYEWTVITYRGTLDLCE